MCVGVRFEKYVFIYGVAGNEVNTNPWSWQHKQRKAQKDCKELAKFFFDRRKKTAERKVPVNEESMLNDFSCRG